jgi:hypothetical protein
MMTPANTVTTKVTAPHSWRTKDQLTDGESSGLGPRSASGPGG